LGLSWVVPRSTVLLWCALSHHVASRRGQARALHDRCNKAERRENGNNGRPSQRCSSSILIYAKRSNGGTTAVVWERGGQWAQHGSSSEESHGVVRTRGVSRGVSHHLVASPKQQPKGSKGVRVRHLPDQQSSLRFGHERVHLVRVNSHQGTRERRHSQ
jgi:hypothetical protein